MMRTLPKAVLIVAVAGAALTPLTAQQPTVAGARPNFAGSWVLEGAPESGVFASFGSRFTATQTATSLTLDIVTVLPAPLGGAGSAGPPHRIEDPVPSGTESYDPPR